MVIAELLVDCRDAMGANVVNTMAEAVAPMLEKLTNGNANLTNHLHLADRRIARATGHSQRGFGRRRGSRWNRSSIRFRCCRSYRCATTTRSDERSNGSLPLQQETTLGYRGRCTRVRSEDRPLLTSTRWSKDENGDLEGFIEIPAAVGIVGG